MPDTFYLISFIAVMGGATFATRATSFILFNNKGNHPAIEFLGAYLPPAIMLLLVIYCFKDVEITCPASLAAEIVSLALVAVLHLTIKNPLISIGAGTLCYMMMVQA
ncbi:MAG: branched-chain amino acid transporter [Proteobacteria bacterium]|nr:MAG: branched-chain amino acid transporter [Pseudomonadota bacterium]PIE40472.1 MAG: branched-chain amino acid transporter [Gammaproteobacteria bacterium]